MIYDIGAKITEGKIIYSPKNKRGDSKGYRLRLMQRVSELNREILKPKLQTPKESPPVQLTLFIG